MAEQTAIARPYAQAAFELASEAGQLDAWSDALAAAAIVVADPQVARLIGAPGTDNEQLVGLIAGIAGEAAPAAPADRFGNLLRLLAENGRLGVLPTLAEAFDALKAETEGRVEVTLSAASPVGEAEQQRIVAALKQRFGRDVGLTVEIDETLIGGARLRADDLVIDGSVRARLDKLASVLSK